MIKSCSIRDRNNVTPEAIVSNVMMNMSCKDRKSFILVEGVTDQILLGDFIDHQKCIIIVCDGKEKLLKAIALLKRLNKRGVIGIYDKDYDEFTGKNYENSNVFSTDANDIECMILQTKAYDEFEKNYVDKNKLAEFKKDNNIDLQDYIRKISTQIGAIRLVNAYAGKELSLDFNQMDIDRYISDRLHFNIEAYLGDIVKYARKEQHREAIKEDAAQYVSKQLGTWKLCRGHDLTGIIASLYSDSKAMNVGNIRARFLRRGRVEKALREFYNIEYFIKTDLYKKIIRWTVNNTGYVVFKD